MLWVSVDNRDDVLFFEISLNPQVPHSPTTHEVLIIDVSGPIEKRLSKFMRSVWLLSSQQDIAEQMEQIVSKGSGKKRIKTFAQKENTVRVVSLKKHAREYQPPNNSQGKWQLNHQIVVSGHWKNQPYGPRESGLRRPQYIRPYIKGPDGAKLIVRPTVKVWS